VCYDEKASPIARAERKSAMSHTLTISDETYQRLEQLADTLGKPLEDIVADLAKQGENLLVTGQSHNPIIATFDDEVEWMRHLGMSEDSIARVMAEPVEPE
jgi:glutamate-1-semialdehyde aminotransferase